MLVVASAWTTLQFSKTASFVGTPSCTFRNYQRYSCSALPRRPASTVDAWGARSQWRNRPSKGSAVGFVFPHPACASTRVELIVQAIDKQALVTSAFDLLVQVFQARRASLMLRSAQAHDELIIARAAGLEEQVVRECRIRIGTLIAGRVVAEARPLLVRDINVYPGRPLERRTHYATPSFASVPVLREGEAVGVVNVADKVGDLPFSDAEFVLLTQFADHLAGCLAYEEQIQQAYELARTDPLTGLLNRRALEEYLSKEIERSKRSGQPGCLLMVDLDRFKVINDTSGHAAGDAALVRVGKLIKEQVRRYDSVFRYGGDEFMVLLPATSPDQAHRLARRIRHAIATVTLFESGALASRRVTASIGAACFPGEAGTPAELLAHTDAALFQAKASDTNQS
jgi:diguanylate cyclase (GGDEF)-like protein